MSLFKYQVFHTVVQLGSLTKAAETLNLTQSGISHALSSLESEFGFSVLKRDRTGIHLTSNGERILEYVREILLCNERLEQEVSAINGFETGTVNIGTFTSISIQWLPGIIKNFRRLHPAINIRLFEGIYDDIGRWIGDGTIDFGFMSLLTARSFDFVPLKKDPILCVLPDEHPLRAATTISFEQIKDEEFIIPKWGNADDLRRILYQNISAPKIKYETAEGPAIIAMVQTGLGIGILPEMALLRTPQNVRAVKLEKSYHRTIGIAARSLKNLSPAACHFVDCTKAWLASQGLLDS